ncbi:MAG: GTP-binding protein [Microgenomates group bacterium Gr01-1014_16]|nr:MAG: GTP-binding protein [Microgenomates group bacterium Gr01-1014_16]
MLKQTHSFRDNQAEMSQTTILDNNDLEREKGITILSKNTAVNYHGVKINIIDTPGHADFGGEVERVLNMADAALLVVDAAEGPLPQTKFVLEKALVTGLKIILVINKIDRKDANTAKVLQDTEELFLKLATHSGHLDFPIVYAVGRDGRAGMAPDKLAGNLEPLFEIILKEVPNAVKDLDKPVKMLVSTLDFDSHLGKMGIGRISQGTLKVGQRVTLVGHGSFNIERLYTSQGIQRIEVQEAVAGDIVAVAGIEDLEIGMTIADPAEPSALPTITVTDPTLKMTIGANTSPFAGRDGKYVTSRQIGERLEKEIATNLGMKFNDLGGGEFEVAGRGELHLAILLETLRREGFETQVSRPQVIFKGNTEPFEEVIIDIPDEYVGVATVEMGKRRGKMSDMAADGKGNTRIVYEISQRNMIGVRNILLTATKGTSVINRQFSQYKETEPAGEDIRPGALVALDRGKALAYSLENAQLRGITFIEPGEEVYEGMIVGMGTRENDVELNVCKGKHLTNTRAASADIKTVLTPAVKMSLEQALEFINDDELLEITPKNLRFRKKFLTKLDRIRQNRKVSN